MLLLVKDYTLTQYAFQDVSIQALLPILACQTFSNEFLIIIKATQQKAGSTSCCLLGISLCDVTFIHINALH